MTTHDRDELEELDIIEEMEDEIEEIENEEGEIDEEKLEEAVSPSSSDEVSKLKDMLTRTQADYQNFQTRVERDKSDMIFFLKQDIFKKILPRIDDLERIIKNTPEEEQVGAMFDGIKSIYDKLIKDLENIGVKSFISIGEEIDPEKHDVMTQVPGEEGIIVDEFENGYELDGRVLRHAKVVVGNG